MLEPGLQGLLGLGLHVDVEVEDEVVAGDRVDPRRPIRMGWFSASTSIERDPGVPRRSSSYTFSTPYFPILSLSVYGLGEPAVRSNSSSMIWPV